MYWLGQKLHLDFSMDGMAKPKGNFWLTQYMLPKLPFTFFFFLSRIACKRGPELSALNYSPQTKCGRCMLKYLYFRLKFLKISILQREKI